MLEIGTNSYVTIEEADLYVSTHYRTSDVERETWTELSEEDKQVLLLQASSALEQLPIIGRKSSRVQSLAFPRWPMTEVPMAVKHAQIEEAVARGDGQSLQEHAETAGRLRRGVRSFSIGNFSESYRVNRSIDPVLVSEKAATLLQRYTGGGFLVCP